MSASTHRNVRLLVGDHDYLLNFWDEISEEERAVFYSQISSINFAEMDSDFSQTLGTPTPICDNLEPVDDSHQESVRKLNKEQFDEYWNLGLEEISKNKVAALVLAGGQASRLGTIHPKGTVSLNINVSDGDSLLSIQAAKIKLLQQAADRKFHTNCRIQWLIMTSSGTHAETRQHVDFLVKTYGLDQDQVTMFTQKDIPAFSMNGKYLLASKSSIVVAPNGNGGLYDALEPVLPSLAAKGVKYFHVYCVDNILCKVADPAFIGFAKRKNADVVAKTIAKQPGELVGSVCLDNGRPRVVEYSELGAELADKKTADGRYLFGAGSIANHLFTVDFLGKVCGGARLPYHVASKKIPHIDPNGQFVKPQQPNGIKLEKFVFDVFEHSENFHLWEVERADEFSPLKNAEHVGKDCITTCSRDLRALNTKWLEKIGASIAADLVVYVRAGVSYNGEGLEELAGVHLTTENVGKYGHLVVIS